MAKQTIKRLETRHYQRLHAITIQPQGTGLVIIAGKNAQGKSSALDSIEAAVRGKTAYREQPVNDTADKASIVLELDNLVIKRTITNKGNGNLGGNLTIDWKEGKRPDGGNQTALDTLYNKIAFDMGDLLGKDKAKREKIILDLVGLDLSDLDQKYNDTFQNRTVINRLKDEADARRKNAPYHHDAPAEEVSIEELTAAQAQAESHNEAIHAAQRELEAIGREMQSAVNTANHYAQQVQDIDAEIAHLQAKRESIIKADQELRQSFAGIQERYETQHKHVLELETTRQDTSTIRQKILDAETINKKVRQNQERLALDKEYHAKKDESDRLTAILDSIKAEKQARIAAAQFPVDDMTYDTERGLMLNGRSLSMASQAETIKVWAMVAIKMNPQWGVFLIRDGNDLDEDSMQMLGEIAVNNQCQFWVERVDTKTPGAYVIYDGQLAAINPN